MVLQGSTNRFIRNSHTPLIGCRFGNDSFTSVFTMLQLFSFVYDNKRLFFLFVSCTRSRSRLCTVRRIVSQTSKCLFGINRSSERKAWPSVSNPAILAWYNIFRTLSFNKKLYFLQRHANLSRRAYFLGWHPNTSFLSALDLRSIFHVSRLLIPPINGDSQQDSESPKFFFEMDQIAGFITLCANQRHRHPRYRRLVLCTFIPSHHSNPVLFTQILHSAAAWQSKTLGIEHLSFSFLVGHSSPRPFVFLSDIDSIFLAHFCTSHTLSEFITDHLLKFLLATWSSAHVFDPERIFWIIWNKTNHWLRCK